MKYKVVLERKARRCFERLSPDVLRKADMALTGLEADPRPLGVEKLAGYDLWRIRVGDYRIIYEIDDRGKTIVVYKIKHRKDAYRKL